MQSQDIKQMTPQELIDWLQKLNNENLPVGDLTAFDAEVNIIQPKFAEGAFSIVHKGFYNKKNISVAVKEFKESVELSEIAQELNNLSKNNRKYPFIIRCIAVYAGIVKQKFNIQKLDIYLIFPLAEGDVYTLIKENKIFNESQQRLEVEVEIMLEQVLNALRFLKNQLGIIHRDIKPKNILLLEQGIYCLADFGISKYFEKDFNQSIVPTNKVQTFDFMKGTIPYLAPELIKIYSQYIIGQIQNTKQIFNSEKCDIFSLGVSCLEILGKLTLEELKVLNIQNGQAERQKVLEKIKIQRSRLRNTIVGMLQEEVEDRFDINESLISLIRENPQLQQSLRADDKNISEQQFRIKQLEEETQKLNYLLHQSRQAVQEQQKQIQDYQNQLNQMQAYFNSQDDKTQADTIQIQKLQQDKQQLQIKKQQALNEIQAKEIAIEKQQKNLKNLETAYNNVKDQEEGYQLQIQQLSKINNDLKNEIQNLKQQVNLNEQQFQAILSEKEIIILQLTDQIETTQQQQSNNIASLLRIQQPVTETNKLSEEQLEKTPIQQIKLSKEFVMQDNGNTLCQQFKDMKYVLKLNIDASWQSIGDEGARNLPAALAEIPQLLVLQINLDSNDITNEGAARIAQALSTLTNLTKLELYLQFNKIENKGAAMIAQALSTLKNLRQIDLWLAFNQIEKQYKGPMLQLLHKIPKKGIRI